MFPTPLAALFLSLSALAGPVPCEVRADPPRRSAVAEPPKLDVPAEVKPVGDYAVFVPKGEAKAVTYVGLSGVDPVPSLMLRDPRTFVLAVRGLPAGRYKFRAVGSLNDEHAVADFEVLVGNAPPPVPPNPGPTPPNPPGPTPPPDGPLGLVRISWDGANAVQLAGGDMTKRAALAARQKALASAIVAVPAQYSDPEKVLEEWRTGNREALGVAPGADPGPWGKLWGAAVSKKLEQLYDAGKLKAPADWAAAFREIATGLGG